MDECDRLSRPRRKSEQLAPASSAPLSVKTALNYYGCMKTMLAAAVRIGLCDPGRDITVKLAGGDLTVSCTDERILLTGEVTFVFAGEFEY